MMKPTLIISVTLLTLILAASVAGFLINEMPVAVEEAILLPPRTEIIETTHPESGVYRITNLKCSHSWNADDVIQYIAREMQKSGWETVKEKSNIYRLSKDTDQIRIVLHQHKFKTTFTVHSRQR